MPTKIDSSIDEHAEEKLEHNNANQVSAKEFHLRAPFIVLHQEKLYWFWFATLIISFLGILVSVLNGEIETSISSGAVYSTCIAIVAPFILEFFVELTVKRRKQITQNFITYKSIVFAGSILYIVFSCVILGSTVRSVIWLQILYTFLSAAFSFYIYLVTKMDDHNSYLLDYADKEYSQQFNESAEKLNNNAKRLDAFNTDDGRSINL